jgi:archaellum component FlaC
MGELLGEIVKANDEVDFGTEPMGRFETSVRNVKDESKELATTLGRVDEAFDPLNEGIETATTRLDKFFEALDQQAATDEFIEDLTEIAEQLNGVREGTEQWTDLQNDAYEALRQLREERDDLSDSFLEVLKLEIDTGDLDYAVQLLQKVDDYLAQGFAPGFQGLAVPTSTSDILAMGINAPSSAGAGDGLVGSTNYSNVTVNMPAGTDPAWLQSYLNADVKRNGSLDISTSSTVR